MTSAGVVDVTARVYARRGATEEGGAGARDVLDCVACPAVDAASDAWVHTIRLEVPLAHPEGQPRRYLSNPRHVKAGDVVRVRARATSHDASADPGTPASVYIVEEMWVSEPWKRFLDAPADGSSSGATGDVPTGASAHGSSTACEAAGEAGVHGKEGKEGVRANAYRHTAAARGTAPVAPAWSVPQASFMGIPQEQQTQKQKQQRKRQPAPPPDGGRRCPVALLQCQASHAERVAAYFGGEVATSYNKNMRLVYVYDGDHTGACDGGAAHDESMPPSGAKTNTNATWRAFIAQALASTGPGEATGATPSPSPLPQYFCGAVQRVFFVNAPPVASLAEAAARVRGQHLRISASQGGPEPPTATGATLPDPLACDADDPSRTRRLFVHPKALEAKVRHLLGHYREGVLPPTPDGFAAPHPHDAGGWPCGVSTPAATGCPLYDSICFSDGLYWLGLSTPRITVPDEHDIVAPCGAYWKLREVRERYVAALPGGGVGANAFVHRGLALDVGSSPGGWSYSLARDFRTATVLAVDPAEYYSPVVDEYRNTHMEALFKSCDGGAGDASQMEDAAAPHAMIRQRLGSPGDDSKARPHPLILPVRLRGEDALQTHVMRARLPVALYVSDMNCRMEDTVALAESVYTAGLYESPALVVLTFKNNCKSHDEFAHRTAACRTQLSAWLTHVTEMHLFANTPMETTVMGVYLGDAGGSTASSRA